MQTPNVKMGSRALVLLAMAVYGGNFMAQAQSLTTIYSFTGANGDREYPFPEGQMLFDSNGALYGTTASGGMNYNGTVFQLLPPYAARGRLDRECALPFRRWC